jgi:hypothetical protein
MTTWLAFAPALLLAGQAAETPPADALKVEGSAVVFVAPVGPTGDALRQQVDRLREDLLKKKVKAVETTPTLMRFGDEDNPRKRVRQIDFRRTPQFVGTVLFTESYDPQIRQGLETDDQLLKRLQTYLDAAKKAKAQPTP